MKKLAAILIVGISVAANAQWYNGMSQKAGLVLSIHLTDSTARIYSPMQSSAPIPVSKWSLVDDTLRIECKGIGLKTVLHRSNGTLQGYWKQGLLKEDITFSECDTIFTLQRPQTPTAPFRFDEETVAADYTDSQGNAVHLEGTLTYPKDGGRYPCLVLVSGSGQQNRDEELLQHRPFLVLADYLASRGIAVLRYDDRGVGGSTGPLDSADTRLFAEDAEAMLRAVAGNRHADTACLGIGGHSEGGVIAPMVASRCSLAKFVVMLAGQGCTGLDVMVQQNEALFSARGISPRLCSVRADCMREMLLFSMRNPDATVKDYRSIIARHTEGLDKAEADSIELKKGMAYTLKEQLGSRWMQTFLALDPADFLPQVKVPLLALNGSKDCQVLCTPNLQRIKLLLPDAECHAVAGLNHLFQPCRTGSPDEYMLIDQTFDTAAMQMVADFIARCRRQ